VHVCDEEKSLGIHFLSLHRARDRAANYVGVARQTIARLLSDDMPRLDPGEDEKRDRGMVMSEEDAAAIRPALIALVLEKKTVSLDTLLHRIKTDNPDWSWSRSTLDRALKNRCGIRFVKRVHDYYARPA